MGFMNGRVQDLVFITCTLYMLKGSLNFCIKITSIFFSWSEDCHKYQNPSFLVKQLLSNCVISGFGMEKKVITHK